MERQHPDVWKTPKKVVRDEIHTDNVEYAAMLFRLQRDYGRVPHAGYMWRVTQIERIDHSQTINWGGIYGGPEPGLYHIPGPTAFVVLLERNVPQNEG